jgi:four helix bundle protein
MVRDHRKLTVFQLTNQLVLEVYRLTARFPNRELFGLTAQLRRSAVSAAANIVEGAARRSPREFDRYLEVSFGSLRETGYYLELSGELGYVREEPLAAIRVLHSRAAGAMSALIRSRANRSW